MCDIKYLGTYLICLLLPSARLVLFLKIANLSLSLCPKATDQLLFRIDLLHHSINLFIVGKRVLKILQGMLVKIKSLIEYLIFQKIALDFPVWQRPRLDVLPTEPYHIRIRSRKTPAAGSVPTNCMREIAWDAIEKCAQYVYVIQPCCHTGVLRIRRVRLYSMTLAATLTRTQTHTRHRDKLRENKWNRKQTSCWGGRDWTPMHTNSVFGGGEARPASQELIAGWEPTICHR